MLCGLVLSVCLPLAVVQYGDAQGFTHNDTPAALEETCHNATPAALEETCLVQAALKLDLRGSALAPNASSKDASASDIFMKTPQSFKTDMYTVLLGNFKNTRAFVLGCALMFGLVIFELIHLRYSDVDFDQPFAMLNNVQNEQSSADSGPVAGAVRLWRLYLVNSWKVASVCVGLIAAMIVMGQYVNLLLVAWSSAFWEKLTELGREPSLEYLPEVQALLLQFLFYAFMVMFSSAYQGYVQTMLVIKVRTAVTERYVGNWLQSFSFYRLELMRHGRDGGDADNPDQRIQEDANIFISNSIGLATSAVSNVIQFFIFSATVFALSPTDAFGVKGLNIPGWLLWCSLIYAGISTSVTLLVSQQLEALTGTNQRSEADFRYELTTLRRYAEAVALGRSEDVHREELNQRFSILRRSIWENMFMQKRFMIVSSFFSQAEVIVPIFLLAPSYLQGEINMGQIMAANRAIGLLDSALLWFMSSFDAVAMWRASTGRLVRFEDAIARHAQEMSGGAMVREAEEATMSIEKLSVWAPLPEFGKDGSLKATHRTPLFNDLNLSIAAGSRVLLCGPSGAGKSTFFRALSGIWPFAEGTVSVPGGQKGMLFFPTEVYIPPGKLHAAVAYPYVPGKGGVSKNDVEDALKLVGLESLLADSGGLACERDWGLALSAGQKQRLALARLVLHQPKVAALDEPVAHLDVKSRAPILANALNALDPKSVVIVISHDMSDDITSLFNVRYNVDQDIKKMSKD